MTEIKKAQWAVECPHCDALNLVGLSDLHQPEYPSEEDEGLQVDCECFDCGKEFYFILEVTLVSF